MPLKILSARVSFVVSKGGTTPCQSGHNPACEYTFVWVLEVRLKSYQYAFSASQCRSFTAAA